MAYRYGNRHQMELLPSSIEEYVKTDDPVRAYDAFVETINFNKLGLHLDSHKPRFGKLSCFMAKTHFWTFKSYDFILRCKSRWQSLLLILKDLLFV